LAGGSAFVADPLVADRPSDRSHAMVNASWRRMKRARSAALCGAVDAAAGSFEGLTTWLYPTCV
jgi:hypothetical protein